MRFVRGTILALVAGCALIATVVLVLNLIVVGTTTARVHDRPEGLRPVDVGLVLGASPWSLDGAPSEHFAGRIEAAAELYRRGLVRHLLLSGANPEPYYNEPLRMRDALIARGVPAAELTLDYAGRRTLDSVVRAREIFGVPRTIIISQRYHVYRALFLARHRGLEASAYVAEEPAFEKRAKTEVREVAARVLAVLDVYLLDTRPQILGPPEPIRLDP